MTAYIKKQKCMLEEFIWGPVRGKTPWRGTGSFPLTPRVTYFQHTFLNQFSVHH
jgi:hypothetical protein